MTLKRFIKDEKGIGIIYGIFVFITTIAIFAIAYVSMTPLIADVVDVSNKWTEDNPELYQEDVYTAKVTTKTFFKYSPFVVVISLVIMLIVIAIKREDET